MDETREVAVKREDALLSQAIEHGLSTETLEKLIALRNAEIARQAKGEFDQKFALMQAEFTPVGKTNRASDRDGNKLYSYCPIEVILMMAAPILAKHGFAYNWEEEALPSKEKRIWCIISGYGHERRGFVDIPYMDPVTKATNVVQMRGSATTYGKRYSFLNATGIIVAGEDNDALSNSAPGTVKAEIIPDESGESRGNQAELPPDPVQIAMGEAKAEISTFVTLVVEEFDGKALFSNEDKAFYKAKIAAVNEAVKQEKDLLKAWTTKRDDIRTLNEAIREELRTRKGHTELSDAMRDALKDKKIGEQKEIF